MPAIIKIIFQFCTTRNLFKLQICRFFLFIFHNCQIYTENFVLSARAIEFLEKNITENFAVAKILIVLKIVCRPTWKIDPFQVHRSRSSNRSFHHQLATHRCIDEPEFHHHIHHHVRKRCTGTHHQNKHRLLRPHHRCNREFRRTTTIDRCTRDRW